MNDERTSNPSPNPQPDALALAIERREWERIAHYLWISAAVLLETADDATIDDLIDLLALEDDAR